MMMNHFHRDVRGGGRADDSCARTTRSSAEEMDDWVVDSDAVNITVCDHRRLSRYSIEQLMMSREKTRLLVLVRADEDDDAFSAMGKLVNEVQKNEIASIGGRKYIRLKCTITNANSNVAAMTGEASTGYTPKMFQDDYKFKDGLACI